jgi:formylmethanofuran dehydrogenase subunit E
VENEMKSIQELLAESAARHQHLCPRQVLGVRMGLWAGELLGLPVPQADKRLLTIVETDGCFADGVAVATNCWVGRRTMRVEDYGKVAATFVDTASSNAIRIAPHPQSRQRAHDYAPEAQGRWEAMLYGYQRMPVAELLVAQRVQLVRSVAEIVSHADRRVTCDLCCEEIVNGREVRLTGLVLCRACAGEAYYWPIA